MSKDTQGYRVLNYMREHDGITQLEALNSLGVMRLASRISDLKKRGYHIESETARVKNRYGEVCRVKCYKLKEEE